MVTQTLERLATVTNIDTDIDFDHAGGDGEEARGLIFNIQRFSIHDGPGIRTTVFLKGCSLQCFWCHNPEGMRAKIEVQLHPEKCIACDECIRLCPPHARVIENGVRVLHRNLCDACGLCTDACFAGAMELTGHTATVDEVMREIAQDRAFYMTSGGGVTLSGGEPVLQSAFALQVLQACKEAGIPTAIETAGNYPWSKLAPLLPYVDLVMMDLKQMDSAKHRWATKVPNERILDTARQLALTDKPILFRIPVIPTVNDQPDEVRATANFVHALIDLRANSATNPAPITLELLPFHKLAGDKYRSLDLDHRAADLEPLSHEQMLALAEVANGCGVAVHCR